MAENLRALAAAALPAAVLSGAMLDSPALAADADDRAAAHRAVATWDHIAMPTLLSVEPRPGAVLRGEVAVRAIVDAPTETRTAIELRRDGRWCTDATMEVGAQIHGRTPHMSVDTTRFADGVYEVHVAVVAAGGGTATRTHEVRIDNSGAVRAAASRAVVEPTRQCRALLSRADGTLVADHLVEASAASLRHLDGVQWRLPDGEYTMRIEPVET